MKQIILFLICIVQWQYTYAQADSSRISISIADKGSYMTYKTTCFIPMLSKTEYSVYPPFTINVPKLKNKYCVSELPYLHAFLYKNMQSILIRIIPEDKSADNIKFSKIFFTERDSTYVPSKDDVIRLLNIINSEYLFDTVAYSEPRWKKVQNRLKTMEKNINKNNKKRKNLIIETKSVIILLFNIKNKNIDEYKKLMQSFTFKEYKQD